MSAITVDRKVFNAKGGQMVVKEGKKQIFILQLANQVFALDNRCPHEGYPLSQGSFDQKSCILTCNWHNWKFDLNTGTCTVGGDNVKTYPVKIQKETIKVDITEPSAEEMKRQITKGLKVAFEKRAYGQIGRELARYLFNNLDPLDGLKQAILWSYDKFQYGMTHAYAGAADWLYYYHIQTKNAEDRLISLTEAIDHIAFDALRRESYPFTKKSLKYEESLFLKAIEDEDQEKAVALMNGGIEAGRRFGDFKKALTSAALDHYNDFGHSLIYVYKASRLCSLLNDPEIDRALLLSLVRSLVYATREDLLPEFKHYGPTVEKLNKLNSISGSDSDSELGPGDLLGKRIEGACKWIVDNFSGPPSIKGLYDTLLCANAYNLLHFDIKYQNKSHNPVTQNTGWLSFTHALTFSNAVRALCCEFPQFWNKGLAQMALFYGRNSTFTTPLTSGLEKSGKSTIRKNLKRKPLRSSQTTVFLPPY